MADEQLQTAPVESQEAQNTTMTEATSEAPAVTTEAVEAPATTEAMDTSADNTETKENDIATAGPQATTEVNAPDGEGKTEVATLPSDVADAADAATPSGNKNGKRKSTSGVPEHKSKKLNKKKSLAQLNLDIKAGDYYWARLKGYPPWPSVVCDEDMLPEILLGSRPVSAKRADGSYREDFEDEGKNARDRTYPVMFLGTNEFSWMVNTSLAKLEPGECTPDKQTGKMSKALKEAYDIAEERHDLDYFKNMLEEFMQQQKQAQEEAAAKQAEKEAKAAAKAEKAEKAAAEKTTKEKKDRRKSKSKETVSDGDDMDLDVPEEAEKPNKKRKKDADDEGEAPKAKKTPKAPKVAAAKTNGESAKKATKPRKIVQKPADEEPITEAEKQERREKAVLYLRHRLQKGFLMRDQTPKEDEMSSMNDFFNQLEGYQNLEPSIIRGTKIYKVLRGIIKLSSIPKEEEYQFKKRSNDLLASWHEALGSKGDEKEDEKAEEQTSGEKSEEVVEKTEPKEPTEVPAAAAADQDVAMTDAKEENSETAPAAASETATTA
ncbi:hypothetical protein AUEXF2481DRAFT_321291 [Aureobasidium subglaciale EXF-2481]|uniref:PWWP domain-containing protein n=1 Tax=Aureobasidium subglaciale (strain EXF-2481) TaxID=1043005 RepID=A0A074YBS0_AURSE|nr:uncharacterized protein AUEXF2481DRAFT_321291 [Aureobasidium subglaciale EXF-2481]KEQ93469.1 hypothetical protein AUEXF2481DRAFT_321291 [Aureobasidium subglaciale EXF-2481]